MRCHRLPLFSHQQTVCTFPQVVAFQATMELMAQQFPGAFSGYKLEVVESHQRTKVDTSGTAKAIVASFQELGVDFSQVRPQTQGVFKII